QLGGLAMAVETAPSIRQSIKVSERTAKLLRVLAALDDTSQVEIADSAIAAYVEQRKKSLTSRLGEIQNLIDNGGEAAVSRAFGKRTAKRGRI
ncbi:MAG: hypothetical protein ACYDHH_33670, partial [Solirubrobacteraceae bacterium]